ncbi:MAG: type III-A CRISPR-associated protein Cas10/Csm1 [Rhodocyclaceae bacterium]|nr:CRISPR-associated protein Cas10/Csm1 [Bacteroidia bacterium]MCQ3925408.1 type III-A CRISPR-associated protein Cas10/Csm1 [Rhodocyclaceae bacterium]
MPLIVSSSRVALAALLHDLGKFAERARLPCEKEKIETYKQLDCPHWDGRPSHIHAAYTTAGFIAIEALLPKRESMMAEPFAEAGAPETDDSLINAAARHHRPGTFLQWIIATADRLASGFERSEFDSYNRAEEGTATGRNHYQARLLPLFESIALEGDRTQEIAHCLPLAPLSPRGLFPRQRVEIEPHENEPAQQEYADLWQAFAAALERIPASHRGSLPLWLDHFDSAWLAFTHAIPSATAGKTRPDVSLYDHSKAAAALAVALWRWHEAAGITGDGAIAALKEHGDWSEEKFLLVQGDFSGIQDFIFAEGGQTQARAARLLRGRSFQVSLLAELAALAVLEALGLPPTSQIVNAAGKFLIVAPNTNEAHAAIAGVRRRIDAWCLEQTFGECSINIAALPAASADFEKGRFDALIRRLFDKLDAAKLARFDLCGREAPAPIRATEFSDGPCEFDGRRPAQTRIGDDKRASFLAADQIAIGKHLADNRFNRLLVVRTGAELRESATVKPLALDYFGHAVAFARDEDQAGRFGELAGAGELLRCWDFTLPDADAATPLFQGYARRDINGFVPVEDGQPVMLDALANRDQGVEALAILKGDVDHLGAIFQQGLRPATFARMASVSRQLNAFFAIHLPWLCRAAFPGTYTVFAGGDDFFLIGPWRSTQELARRMRRDFSAFVAGNPQITFSAGIALAKPGHPVRALALLADEALQKAKDAGRNRITTHGQAVAWAELDELAELEQWLDERRAQFSTGFVYRLLHLAEKAASGKPEDAIWQSWLAYRVRRFVVDRLPRHEREAAQSEIAGKLRQAIARGKLATCIPIANYLYRYRD